MRQFIQINDFINWFIKNCEEPFPMTRMHQDFESCQFVPCDYLSNILSLKSMEDLLSKVEPIDEIQLETI